MVTRGREGYPWSGSVAAAPGNAKGALLDALLPERRIAVMGVLNVTPDSFYDGGCFLEPAAAVERGIEMVDEGADLIDVGGESSRPGALPVPEEEELSRVVPVIERLSAQVSVPISIDTMKAAVAGAALDAGASLINDISAGSRDGRMLALAAERGCPIVLMHMQGTPQTMQEDPRYRDVVDEVRGYLSQRRDIATAHGIEREQIVLDPGIGFGKRLEHNLALLRDLPRLAALGSPLLVGVSRKSFIGRILDLPAGERIEGTAAAVALAVAGGARIVRVHDVSAMARVVRVAEAICGGQWLA